MARQKITDGDRVRLLTTGEEATVVAVIGHGATNRRKGRELGREMTVVPLGQNRIDRVFESQVELIKKVGASDPWRMYNLEARWL